MSPAETTEYLEALRKAGGGELAISFPDGTRIRIKLTADATPAAAFIDRQGKPVNLDEGAPWNTREPDTGDELYKANFPGQPDEAA